MGTRAQFFVGNSQDLEGRKYLGTIAWDGYPDGFDAIRKWAAARTPRQFEKLVLAEISQRDDYADPATRAFPFPWTDNLFLTDYTYAFFDGKARLTCFNRGWITIKQYLRGERERERYFEGEDELPENVPAPASKKPRGPDSIMVVGVRVP